MTIWAGGVAGKGSLETQPISAIRGNKMKGSSQVYGVWRARREGVSESNHHRQRLLVLEESTDPGIDCEIDGIIIKF